MEPCHPPFNLIHSKVLMTRNIFAVLAATLSLATSAAQANDICPVISASELAQAFQSDGAKLLAGQVSGLCTWALEDGSLINMQTHKRPTASEARLMYDTFAKTTTARLTRTLSQPKIGQRALVAMTAASAPRAEFAVLALDQETLVAISYYPQSGAEQIDDIRTAMESVGALVLSHKAAADQTFGQCELLDKKDIDRLLGKGKKTIHRLGADQCIASVQPGGSSLVAMITPKLHEKDLEGMYESAADRCTRVLLPELGKHAFATYACEAPGDSALTVYMAKDDAYTEVVFSPSERKAGAADLEALRAVAQRIQSLR